jgi:hypothetical protein
LHPRVIAHAGRTKEKGKEFLLCLGIDIILNF